MKAGRGTLRISPSNCVPNKLLARWRHSGESGSILNFASNSLGTRTAMFALGIGPASRCPRTVVVTVSRPSELAAKSVRQGDGMKSSVEPKSLHELEHPNSGPTPATRWTVGSSRARFRAFCQSRNVGILWNGSFPPKMLAHSPCGLNFLLSLGSGPPDFITSSRPLEHFYDGIE